MDDTIFPKGFYDIGLKTFLWVYENKIEWRDFTLNEMKNPTGLYKVWQEYCFKTQIIKKHDKTTSRQSEGCGKEILKN